MKTPALPVEKIALSGGAICKTMLSAVFAHHFEMYLKMTEKNTTNMNFDLDFCVHLVFGQLKSLEKKSD